MTDEPINLLGDELLAHILLRALGDAFGASEIVVTFLGFGGDETATFAAMEKAAVEVRLEVGSLGFALPFHDCLSLIKKPFGNDGLMLALEHLSAGEHGAIVEGVLEGRLVVGDGKLLPTEGTQSKTVHTLLHFVQREVARGV